MVYRTQNGLASTQLLVLQTVLELPAFQTAAQHYSSLPSKSLKIMTALISPPTA